MTGLQPADKEGPSNSTKGPKLRHFRHAIVAYYAAAVADAVVDHVVEGAIGGLASAVLSGFGRSGLSPRDR